MSSRMAQMHQAAAQEDISGNIWVKMEEDHACCHRRVIGGWEDRNNSKSRRIAIIRSIRVSSNRVIASNRINNKDMGSRSSRISSNSNTARHAHNSKNQTMDSNITTRIHTVITRQRQVLSNSNILSTTPMHTRTPNHPLSSKPMDMEVVMAVVAFTSALHHSKKPFHPCRQGSASRPPPAFLKPRLRMSLLP